MTADKTAPALQHTGDRAAVFFFCNQGKGIEKLFWLQYVNCYSYFNLRCIVMDR